MLCYQCKKNEATKVYELVKSGKRETRSYCLECYLRMFVNEDTAEGEMTLSACPYCGTNIEEVRQQKYVGCAYCYQMMSEDIEPIISKMQRSLKPHVGKSPTIDVEEEDLEEADPLALTRCNRQCYELTLIIQKLTAEGNFDDAKGYADKLSRMRSKMAIEEDFVWRGNPKQTKQS